MGTIFKYNDQLIQCKNLQKKLKKMRIPQDSIEIIKDGIPDDSLEKEFVNLTRIPKEEISGDPDAWTYYIFQNSDGNYLWGINMPNLNYIKKFGFDVSDYKLIDTCTGTVPRKYYKWNSETKTGRKDI